MACLWTLLGAREVALGEGALMGVGLALAAKLLFAFAAVALAMCCGATRANDSDLTVEADFPKTYAQRQGYF